MVVSQRIDGVGEFQAQILAGVELARLGDQTLGELA